MIEKKTTQELVSERPTPEKLALLSRVPVVVVADNIRSLDNVGLLFRLCELARIELLVLAGYTGYPRREGDARPENVISRHENRIRKTAVYALPHQPWEYREDPTDVILQKKREGYQVLALEQTKQSIPYTKAVFQLPTILIVGHERLGISENLLGLADAVIEIPILGVGNSHNVAMATGIIIASILEKTGQYEKNSGKS